MKVVTLIGLVLAVSAYGSDGADAAARQLFSFPDAVVTISNESGRMRFPVLDQRQTKPELNPGSFRSGFEKQKDGESRGGMFYHFISKSEYGDIYVVTYISPTGEKEHIPVIFTGSRIEVSRADFKAEIQK